MSDLSVGNDATGLPLLRVNIHPNYKYPKVGLNPSIDGAPTFLINSCLLFKLIAHVGNMDSGPFHVRGGTSLGSGSKAQAA